MTQHIKALLLGTFAAGVLLFESRLALAQDTPPEVLASQLRLQGYRCEAPITAQRDAQLSRPDEAAWILKCANASYRIRLMPDMAARIERLD